MATFVQVVPSTGEAQIRLGQIQRAHLNYVHLEESTEKLRARRGLESVISEHLSSVPHREKFTCSNFGDVLKRTIDERADFKASGAAQAFDALERYALNLIVQPWRQEYCCVRLYSGFFKHSVEHYLSSAEEIFRLMGYEPADGMELRLNEPIDSDRVTDTALNCIIAAVECQIMMQILEKVGGSYSWKEIARVRRHNVSSADKAADILLRGGGRPNHRLEMSKAAAAAAAVADRALHGASGRRSNGYVRVEKLVDVPGMWTDALLDSSIPTTMEADERYPASYDCTWERKPMSNGSGSGSGGGNGSLNLRRPPVTSSYGEDFEEALSLMQEDRRRSLQSDDGHSHSQTRADSWAFVDQSLERHDNYGVTRDSDLLRNTATSYRKKQQQQQPFMDPEVDYPALLSGGGNGRSPLAYATQKRTRQLPAFSYGRLPSYAKSLSYGVSRGVSSIVEPTIEDLIQLSNPTSNLGFHPGMMTDPLFGTAYSSEPPPLPPTPLPPVTHPYQHFHHPAYASLLQPSAAPQQMANVYLVDRPCKVDLLTAVPPPAPAPPPLAPTSQLQSSQTTQQQQQQQQQGTPPKLSGGKLVSEQQLADLMANIRLRDANALPTTAVAAAVTGGTVRERKSKKQQSLVNEHRRSTYDNIQDAASDSSTGLILNVAPLDTQDVVQPPPPPPSSSSSSSATDKRSMNGSAVRDVHEKAPSTTQRGSTKSDRAHSKDEMDGSYVSATGRRSGGGQSATNPSADKGRLTSSSASTSSSSSSSSSSRPRHERSASVGSTRLTNSARRGSAEKGASWECCSCTFLNSAVRDVCEMCSRSRYKGAESYPLSSGGHECQNCTLVNEKGARKCVACSCTLENSPTYV